MFLPGLNTKSVKKEHCTHAYTMQDSVAHNPLTDSIAYNRDMHWATLQAGLSADQL